MTKEQSKKHIDTKIVAAMLALLVLSVGVGMNAVYADEGDGNDKGESDCTSILGISILCSDSANVGDSATTSK